jgi:hypothetical protein
MRFLLDRDDLSALCISGQEQAEVSLDVRSAAVQDDQGQPAP